MSDVAIALNSLVPDFSATMTGDRAFTLSEYRDQTVVLYFYPKDGTPGCTTESLNFRDLYADFVALGAEIFGISRDTLRSHDAFKAKLDLPFSLISDPDEVVCSLFAVMKTRNMYGKQVRGIERSTFVIDGTGKLVKEWRGLKVPNHANDVLSTVQTLA